MKLGLSYPYHCQVEQSERMIRQYLAQLHVQEVLTRLVWELEVCVENESDVYFCPLLSVWQALFIRFAFPMMVRRFANCHIRHAL